VFSPANNSFQKADVNFTSLSEITILGIPCILKIYFMNISAMFIALKVDFIRIKCADLLSLSITTMIESFCFLFLGKLVIKSSDIVSHFHSGTGNGCNRPVGCWCSALTC
jgi:hypothetical protein